MDTQTSGCFRGNKLWLQSVAGGREWILCHTSALECLELFNGYMNEKRIDVYAKEPGEYQNVNYRIVDSFDGLGVASFRDVRYTSINQTINDMLADFDNIDEQSLAEALSNYYHRHGESFDGLEIRHENRVVFNSVRDWAIDFYNEG
jgi:hypothetical protein